MAPLMTFHESTTMFNEYMTPDLSLDMNGLFNDDDDVDASTKQPMISGESSTIVSPQGSSSSSGYYTPTIGGVIGNNNKATFKRRSRACKKGKTTLLKANAKDFRALVQRLTGYCSRADEDHRPFKGPINLDFSKSSSALRQQQKLRSRIDDVHEEERSDQRFLSFACENNSIISATSATNGNPCTVSSMVLGNPKTDRLSSLDDLPDMENFFLPDFSDPEDCSDLLVDSEFWAC